ncbi:MAG: hypothetical protein ACXV3U_02395 [Halobacteriota archaeon]
MCLPETTVRDACGWGHAYDECGSSPSERIEFDKLITKQCNSYRYNDER